MALTGGPKGVLLAADSISADGEQQGYHEVIVSLDEGMLDIRLIDAVDTILTVSLRQVEEAVIALRKWDAIPRSERA